MKKKYESEIGPSLNPDNNRVNEPAIEYSVESVTETSEIFYDIPNEYLAQRIERAEKDIADGNLISLEEAKRRILK